MKKMGNVTCGNNKNIFILFILLIFVSLVFSPGLQAFFVSDTFGFLEDSINKSFVEVLSSFTPNSQEWYRPLTKVFFWFEFYIFKLNPLPYHVVALLCHLLSSFFIYKIISLLSSKKVALVGMLIFLFDIHSHEIVYDIADLHNAIGGVTFMASIYYYILNDRIKNCILVILTLLINETGILLLPIFFLYELTFKNRKLKFKNPIIPVVLILLGYVVLRTSFSPSGFYNEVTNQCRSVECYSSGFIHYINRLISRPNVLIEFAQSNPQALFGSIVGLFLLNFFLFRSWKRNNFRFFCFSIGWIILSIVLYVHAFWPYTPDRFLYLPSVGLAFLISSYYSQMLIVFKKRTSKISRIAAIGTLIVYFIWVALGIKMLNDRGRLWKLAGDEAKKILTELVVKNKDINGKIIFVDGNYPDSLYKQIPPGNTGPYVFRNGFEAAVRIYHKCPNCRVYNFGKKLDNN